MAGQSGRAWRTAAPTDGFAGRSPTRIRGTAGAVALLGTASIALVRLVRNVPADVPVIAGREAYAVASFMGLVAPAAAAIAVGVVAPTDREWVALVFAGTFALLTAVAGAVSVPAMGVLVVAGALALLPRAGVRSRESVAACAFVAALAVSLGAGSGLLPASARAAGTTVTLIALAATPLVVRPSFAALALGLAAGLATAGATVAAPFVASATVLVVGAAFDPHLVLLAAGVGGAVATAASGVSSGRATTLVGGGLLLAAGVPATVPRALAVLLGARLVLDAADAHGLGGDADAV